MINIGYGNYINDSRILTVVRPDAAPTKRMVQFARDNGQCIDATSGKKCKSVIVTTGMQVVLSALLPETIAKRHNISIGQEEGDLL
ncbi:extracellular matrix/biofilm biosynthesis regulator RemA family protein [Eubacterium sp.]|uniref:DUF370 domain-containing protein n=1 Tax=Eubacterium sp. TaxID=142586 RepID=UPI002587C273|nr:extracellular matrix/biofilm biosynthesis regulator RemA family protein [Eubacterium sp.]MCR5369043.1 DUF370 domain-containing protein [Eubacterium sp.]